MKRETKARTIPTTILRVSTDMATGKQTVHWVKSRARVGGRSKHPRPRDEILAILKAHGFAPRSQRKKAA